MFNKRFPKRVIAVALLCALFLGYSTDAFARGSHRSRHYFSHRRTAGFSCSFIPSMFAGLTTLYYLDLCAKKSPTRYVVVETPVTVIHETASAGRIRVNIPNSDGTYTQIVLRKTEGGYLGPQGELYTGHPTIEQLKVLYGK